jgi:HEAT repeat protein
VLTLAQDLRAVLIPFLAGGTTLVFALFVLLVVHRLLRAAVAARRRRIADKYRPVIDAVLSDPEAALERVDAIPRRHRPVIVDLLMTPLRLVRGGQGARASAIAERLELAERWRRELGARRWWKRSEAALAVGLLRDRRSSDALVRLLDDRHDQVRAAAIDALGQVGDPAAVPALLARLGTPNLHEHVRIVQALRGFGEAAAAALVEHGHSRVDDRRTVATVLSYVGGALAAPRLIEWARTGDTPTRAAAWNALATIGLDDRTFYHALKALQDDEPQVRAAAARALSRSGRADAAPGLAARLDDEWDVAAQAARALMRLDDTGKAALRARLERGPGLGHDLAHQMLWEGSR